MSTEFSPEEIARSHRWHAIECNNLAWELSEQAERTPDQNQDMLNAAHAAAFHWARVGTELNQARAKMLLGQVHALIGDGKAAIVYAQQSYDYVTTNESLDWEIAFAHAILAHAAYTAGETALYQKYFTTAQELGRSIADPEEREIFNKTFNLIPRP